MNKIFVKTTNVKNSIGLIENLINKAKNIPKMGLVYGEPGLGKSQTALWLTCKYDGIYLRASNLMTGRWLLEEMVKEVIAESLRPVIKEAISKMDEKILEVVRAEVAAQAKAWINNNLSKEVEQNFQDNGPRVTEKVGS